MKMLLNENGWRRGGGLVRVWILKIGAKILQDKITVRFSSS